MRLLLVEDDRIIGDGLCSNLRMEGYAPDWVQDKESAETAFAANQYDIIILDIGLPDGSGIDFLRDVRTAKKSSIPVIMLTAYDDTKHKVKGLDTGADDYLIKPFQFSELCARIRALRRRSNGSAATIINVNGIELAPSAKTVKKENKEIQLGIKEFAILQLLMEKAGKLVNKAQLEDSLYGWDKEVESNTVEVHIHGLRKKLGKDFIKTVKYQGYKIEKNKE